MGISQSIDPGSLKNLLEMFNGDLTFINEMIDAFLDDAANLLENLHRAVETNDPNELRRAAHSLKSNSANFGATTLSELSKELEEIGKGSSVLGAAERLPLVDSEFALVRAELEALRENGF